ncbi:MAG: hypothetical protein HOP18_00740 [Deltaproteobacteria bacterium]|nr:hypothetical protein [Deltaproteobacteria bacterium]
MITLHLDEHEHQAVLELLEREIPNLRHEIHHTDDREYREFLKSRERLLEKLLVTVRTSAPGTATVVRMAEKQPHSIS